MRRATLLVLAGALCAVPAVGQPPDAPALAQTVDVPAVEVELTPRVANVGDPLELVLTVRLDAATELATEPLGHRIGEFSVLDGGWLAATADGESEVARVWRGTIAAYRTGELELPPIGVRVETVDGTRVARSEAVSVTIESVLDEAEAAGTPAEIVELKPPASIAPDYGPLIAAAGIVAGLLLLSLLGWWLMRRYRDRFAARPVPADPFHRVPPDVWVYAELKRLLESGLAEQGQIERFHAELAWIVKRYLGARYRVELMEKTTEEVAGMLSQGGAPAEPIDTAVELLRRCDRVKFAKALPDAARCRDEVDQAYQVVDGTRPQSAATAAPERGAA